MPRAEVLRVIYIMAKGKLPFLQLLQERFPEIEKEQHYAYILAGSYRADGELIRDPRAPIRRDAEISRQSRKYVSRGGEKLEHALVHWNIDVSGKVFIDAGASTGGFTDCLLTFGASAVHAVDVGYNQLDFSLRRNPAVYVHERTNVMDLERPVPSPAAAVADLSFRSVVGAAHRLLSLTDEGWGIILIKPQFEYTKEDREFKGVLENRETAVRVVKRVVRELEGEGVYSRGVCESPVLGRKGNREFLTLVALKRGNGQLKELLERGFPINTPSGPKYS
jgi:23S rRNA (cytidine1920-2'-O)/16S rRNA (cytidine1409-2'-O)-methyltransferase